MLDGRSQGIGGSQCVGTGKGAVGEEITAVGSAIDGFPYHFGSTSGPHRHDGDGGAGELVFQSQSLLEGVEVLGIEDGRQRAAVDGAFGSHGIGADVARVGHLLGKHYNV